MLSPLAECRGRPDRTAMVVGESKAVVLIVENDDTSSDASTELGNEALRSPEHRPDGPDRLEELARRDCLIIFDWDDTLLPTTWLGERGILPLLNLLLLLLLLRCLFIPLPPSSSR